MTKWMLVFSLCVPVSCSVEPDRTLEPSEVTVDPLADPFNTFDLGKLWHFRVGWEYKIVELHDPAKGVFTTEAAEKKLNAMGATGWEDRGVILDGKMIIFRRWIE